MSSYVNIGMRFKDGAEPVTMLSLSRSTEFYGELCDNYGWSEEWKSLDVSTLNGIILHIHDEITKLKEQNFLLETMGSKGLGKDNEDAPIDLIMENNTRIADGFELIGMFRAFVRMIEDVEYSDVISEYCIRFD